MQFIVCARDVYFTYLHYSVLFSLYLANIHLLFSYMFFFLVIFIHHHPWLQYNSSSLCIVCFYISMCNNRIYIYVGIFACVFVYVSSTLFLAPVYTTTQLYNICIMYMCIVRTMYRTYYIHRHTYRDI